MRPNLVYDTARLQQKAKGGFCDHDFEYNKNAKFTWSSLLQWLWLLVLNCSMFCTFLPFGHFIFNSFPIEDLFCGGQMHATIDVVLPHTDIVCIPPTLTLYPPTLTLLQVVSPTLTLYPSHWLCIPCCIVSTKEPFKVHYFTSCYWIATCYVLVFWIILLLPRTWFILGCTCSSVELYTWTLWKVHKICIPYSSFLSWTQTSYSLMFCTKGLYLTLVRSNVLLSKLWCFAVYCTGVYFG